MIVNRIVKVLCHCYSTVDCVATSSPLGGRRQRALMI